MDQRLKYEQLIAGKLESLPVPDMEDLIWSRIKAQLDIDLPTDDGNGNGPQPPSGPGIIGWGLSALIIALITAFFIYKNEPQSQDLQNASNPTEQIKEATEQATGPPGVDNIRVNSSTPNNQEISASAVDEGQDRGIQPDITSVLPPLIDSMNVTTQEPLITINLPKDTIPAVKKKGRGVTGIKDDDYRIVPKKDN